MSSPSDLIRAAVAPPIQGARVICPTIEAPLAPSDIAKSERTDSPANGPGATHGLTTSGTVPGLLLALLSCVCFGMSGALAKGLMSTGWSPAATVTVRVTMAALVMAVPAAIMLRGRWGILRAHAGLLAGYGVIAVAGTQLSYFLAVQTLSVSVALLIEFLAPIIVVGWLWTRHGQRPGPVTALGVAAAILGLALVLDLFAARSGMRVDPVGIGWALAAAVCLSTYFVLSARPAPDLPPLVLIAGGLTVGALVLLVAGATRVTTWTWSSDPVVLAGATVGPWVPLTGLVLVTTVIAYGSGLMATRALGSRVMSFVSLTEVLAATGFAWLFLGELPGAIQLLGGVAIVVGAGLVKVGEAREARQAQRVARPVDA
ncbi:MAG: EamA family transporter [Micrococcales bacterium]|nr:EamA family transporter [Micrococcales bacterium]